MNFENLDLNLIYENMYQVEDQFPINQQIHEFQLGDKSVVKRGDTVYCITDDHSKFAGIFNELKVIGQLQSHPDYLKLSANKGDKFTKLPQVIEVNLPKNVLTKNNPKDKKVWTSKKY